MVERGREDVRRTPSRRGERPSGPASPRHRRDARPAGSPADDHLRPRPAALRCAVRAGREAAGGARRPSQLPRGRARAGALRRRPVCAGVRRRPPGGVPRRPQSRPDRTRCRRPALVAARLRPHLEHQPLPGRAAKPHGLQGRHEQHQGRGRARACAARLGRSSRRAGMDRIFRQTPTYGSRPRPSTAAYGSFAAATRSPTGWTRVSDSSTPVCSSSASSATRGASSSRSSNGSPRQTPSTSTSSTRAARSSRARPEQANTASSAKPSSKADPSQSLQQTVARCEWSGFGPPVAPAPRRLRNSLLQSRGWARAGPPAPVVL